MEGAYALSSALFSRRCALARRRGGRARGLRSVGQIDQVGKNIERLIAQRIKRRLLRAIATKDVGIRIPRGFRRYRALIRSGQFSGERHELEVWLVDCIERETIN